MRMNQEICGDLPVAQRREWLETNGIGGYASSTISGMNTRRYHGILVAATRPPVGRMVLLSRMEETLVLDGRAHDLSTNQYPGVIHPEGYRLQTEFSPDPFPVSQFQVEDVVLEKTVFMVHGENSTALRYRLLSGSGRAVRLLLRPLIAFRDYHSLTHANPYLDSSVEHGDGWCSVRPYENMPALYLNHNGAQPVYGGTWYYRFQYEEERQRGLDWEEDLYNPLGLRFDLGAADACVIASTEIRDASAVEELRKAEDRRRSALIRGWEDSDDFARSLVRAADQFLVRRDEDLSSVIAGYHWFTDWGRDTMISLPGLTLVTGRYEEARKILRAFADRCDRGMLPNRFPDEGEEPEYNTVDATLWFFQAVYALVDYTGDYDFVREKLYGTMLEILRHHLEGTRYNIKAEDDGQLNSGEPGAQLTWMDAKVGDWVVTPRVGKPVEIQALWYNALRIVEHLAREFGDSANAKRITELASRAQESFNRIFWNEDGQCLYDCVNGEERDGSIRPNQVFAVSLPFSMLSPERMRKVVDAVTLHLLTPVGLRSLAPSSPAYHGFYGGDQASRDGAYHQGTVWPWLMGPYITAMIRAGEDPAMARRQASQLLDGLRDHLQVAGLGSISEIFDGEPPHAPRGCIAQAWSVAELLRVAVEELSESRRETHVRQARTFTAGQQ